MSKEELLIELRSGRMEINHGRWTQEDRKRLEEMYTAGIDMSDIALILHRSERAIRATPPKAGAKKSGV